jgi:hypothetical protein
LDYLRRIVDYVALILWVYLKSNNGFLKIVATIIVLLNIAYFGFTASVEVGVDQGLSAVQPIAFPIEFTQEIIR